MLLCVSCQVKLFVNGVIVGKVGMRLPVISIWKHTDSRPVSICTIFLGAIRFMILLLTICFCLPLGLMILDSSLELSNQCELRPGDVTNAKPQ